MIETRTIKIPNYQTIELIHQSERTLVYRGRNLESGEPVIIKLMAQEYPSFNELVQFRNQYTIAKNLDIPGIVKPYSLLRYKNGYALIMVDIAAISLAEYLRQLSVSLEQFWEIALQIAEILHHLHQNQIIHKDIKPANILIHPETKEIKLIDFSISSLLPKERTSLQTPNVLEGTLAYLSPEQTGRMNRGIDYRSDFYSLGITFYELLTGKLPFESEDALELVHAHIAKTPPTIADAQVPKPLTDIIVKLMAKNAEHRYQSALGLKHDLEKCRVEYEKTGKIEPFILGEQDRSDRFLIPEKLYGREKEVQILLDAFERVASPIPPNPPLKRGRKTEKGGGAEMMLVAGFSGIGKTAVVNEVHKPITRQKGYFIKGKFDQFNRNIPFSAFVIAFRDLMGQLLGESDAQLQEWKDKILEAVGVQGQVIIDVIPELQQIIGEQPSVPELSGTAAQNRFNLLFQKFISVFTTVEHPLTLFLDDLQWADSASLNLIKVLMGDNQTGYLLLLGAYRDNEVFPAHPLMLTLGELAKQNTTISTITLAPLSVEHINQLVAETLSCSLELAKPLTDLIYQKTKGNPFFTNQFLKGLYEDGLITFNQNLGYWECDLVQVRDAALTSDVVEFMAGRLHKLPTGTQKVLKLAACIGNEFDLETLAIIYETPEEEVAANLWSALREGLILPISEAYKFFQGGEQEEEKADGITVGYRFLHDRVQQAAYSLIPESEKNTTHYQIGKLLLDYLPVDKWEENIFDIINHLNKGTELIKNCEERHQLSELNLIAGKKALAATAYASATKYFDSGIQFLEVDCWQSQYQLALSLYQFAIEAEYLNINFTRAHTLANLVLEKVTSILDRVKVYELRIQMHMAEAEMPKSLTVGKSALDMLGVNFNDAPGASAVQLPELSAITLKPTMEDPEQIAVMRILIAILSSVYIMQPELLSPMLLTAIDRSLRYGHISLTAQAYVWYGLFLCASQKDLEKGYYCGLLALKVLEKYPAQELECCVNNLFNVFIRPWKEPWINSIKPLEKAREVGFDTGDIEYASYATAHRCTYLFLSGENLKEIQDQQNLALEILYRVKQEHSLGHGRIWAQLVSNLLNDVANVQKLSGNYFDEIELLPLLRAGSDRSLPFTAYLAKCLLNYLLEDYTAAVAAAVNAESDAEVAMGITAITYNLYYSLSLLSDYNLSPSKNNSILTENKDFQALLEQIETNQKSMKGWARLAPENCEHKYNLVEAEKCRVLGEKLEAIELYDKAIAGAKENKYIQEEALANELVAKFYLEWGKEKIACTYMQEAYYCYAQWGAKAKIDHLEQNYPQLLNPILQRQKLSQTANSTMLTLSKGTVSNTSKCSGELLDLATLMKASRSLSQEIDLERAIAKFIEVIQENAGAEKVALMLFQADTLMLTAYATGKEMSVMSIPVETTNNLPLTLINRVKNTRANLVLDNAKEDKDYNQDDYFQKHQLQSLLCIPLINRGQLIGVLYLENNQTIGAFTSERIEILNLLCSQAAISLENAQLYNNLEIKVQERTAELSQALQNLKDTQTQLIESEKMASLGGLVAGVAHEISTPIGTSITVASTLNEETEEFTKAIANGQLKRSILNNYVETCTECTQLLGSNLRRAGELIGSFKQVAVDQSNLEIRSFSIKEYLGEVLTSLMPNIRQQGHEVQIKGDDNLELTTYPGALAQIVTNLTNNSLVHGYPNGKNGKLNWRIELKEERLMIEYEDDGCGIAQAELEKIFEPFYTTARNQGGTGLGLHIVYNLVTQKLQGRIWAESQLGEGVKFTMSIPK